jgi:hypothetical protein
VRVAPAVVLALQGGPAPWAPGALAEIVPEEAGYRKPQSRQRAKIKTSKRVRYLEERAPGVTEPGSWPTEAPMHCVMVPPDMAPMEAM